MGNYVPPGAIVNQALIQGSRGYLLGTDLILVNLSNPLSPRVTGRMPLLFPSDYCIAAHDDRVLLGTRQGIVVVDASNPRSARPIGTTNLQRAAEKVAARGDLACVTTGGRSVWVLDASRRNPVVTGRALIGSHVFDVAMDSALAYVACEVGLAVVDIDPRFPPHIVAQQSLPHGARAVTLSGQMAYLVGDQSGLWIFDVSDAKQPRVVGSVYVERAIDITVRDGWAFIAALDRGLVVVDVSDPRSPRIAGEAPLRGAFALCVQDPQLLHVVGDNDSTFVYDISQPRAPRLLSGVNIGPAIEVVADDRFVYVASFWGTQVIDMDSPTAPVFVGAVGSLAATGLAIDGSRLFVSGGNLEVMSLQCDIASDARSWP